ncbi:PH domain-containing protein [Nakamurella aerolata]|uniref:PH domain-containing protein n=1 Tax=Nakamurella aerolata TaxID=1656892 RepID=A0A849A6P6_9ACTN|nr:PH domain-containing protein [Nakamurella aerolata]
MRQRPDSRTAAADALAAFGTLAAGAIGVIIGVRLAGLSWLAAVGVPLAGVLFGTVVVGALSAITVRCTSFAVTDDRIDREFRLGVRHRQLAPVRRIRSVELSANPAQRVFGLADVHIGTGQRTGRLSLHSLRRPEAESLRHKLLRGSGLVESATADQRSGELARFRWSWLRFAQLSFWTPLLGAGAVGISFRVADWFNADAELWRWYSRLPGGAGWADGALLVVIAVLVALLIGAVAATALVLENWWNCRLVRDPDGTLRLTRGLLNQRSSTVDGSRVRGAMLVEPLGARLQGAARVQALAVGAVGGNDNGSDGGSSSADLLLPEVARPLAIRAMAAIVGPVLAEPLQPHPPAARRRRWVRAVAGAVVSAAVLLPVALVIDRAAAWVVAAAALVVLSGAYGWSAATGYRSLGHLLTDRYVIFRSGAWSRRTSALQRCGVVGWQLRRSPLQRRARLVTLTALTSTRTPALTVPDASNAQAQRLLLAAAPYWRALAVEPSAGTQPGAGLGPVPGADVGGTTITAGK